MARPPGFPGEPAMDKLDLEERVGDQARRRDGARQRLHPADRRPRDEGREIVGADDQVGQVSCGRTRCVANPGARVTGRSGAVPAIGRVVVTGVAGTRVGHQTGARRSTGADHETVTGMYDGVAELRVRRAGWTCPVGHRRVHVLLHRRIDVDQCEVVADAVVAPQRNGSYVHEKAGRGDDGYLVTEVRTVTGGSDLGPVAEDEV